MQHHTKNVLNNYYSTKDKSIITSQCNICRVYISSKILQVASQTKTLIQLYIYNNINYAIFYNHAMILFTLANV